MKVEDCLKCRGSDLNRRSTSDRVERHGLQSTWKRPMILEIRSPLPVACGSRHS